MTKQQITFYACGNGDSSLIEAHDRTIMTDINYRANDAQDDKNVDVPDFAPLIREACSDDYLDLFVLTHPDEDHLRGFGEIFHLGKPEDRDSDPDEGDTKILVNEIWCSEYSANPNYTTDMSKPVLDEIKRRKNLIGAESQKDGNRLVVISATDAALMTYCGGIDYRVLAPNASEADIPKAKENEPKNSSNPSSLVIQWSFTVGQRVSKVVLGGDSTVEVWERLSSEYADECLDWHILLSPHHCSRHSMGRKLSETSFEYSNDAISGLNHPIGASAHVVASCRTFGDDHPPHPEARDRYYKILAKGKAITDETKSRFLITDGSSSQKPEHVKFRFTSNGPARAAAVGAASFATPSSSGGGGYGCAT